MTDPPTIEMPESISPVFGTGNDEFGSWAARQNQAGKSFSGGPLGFRPAGRCINMGRTEMRLWICALLIFGGDTARLYALQPGKALTQYSVTVWGQQEGLPQDTIRAITQTADRFLWVGTDEGLARFDG